MTKIQHSGGLGFAQVVKLIEVLAADELELSVEDLAILIEADPEVAAQVLRSANTYSYNPAGVPIHSISQAIQVIGFTKIRMFGMSLLIMDNVASRTDTAEAQIVEAITLTSGILAFVLEEMRGGDQPELHFMAALLRNFGRISAVSVLPEEYRKAATLATEKSDLDQAFRLQFGLTPVELSRELLAHAKISRLLRQSLQPATPEMWRGTPTNAADRLTRDADFVVRLTELTLTAKVDATDFARESRRMCECEGRQIGIEVEMLDELFRQTEEGSLAFAQMFGMLPLAQAINACIEARRTGLAIPDLAARLRAGRTRTASEATGDTGPQTFANPTAKPVPKSAVAPMRMRGDVLHEMLVRAAETLAKPQIQVETLVALAMNALVEGHQADQVFVLAVDDSEHFKAVGGTGERWSANYRQFDFRRDDRRMLSLAVNRGEVAYVSDTADPDIARSLPTWISRDLQVRTGVIVPWGTPAPARLVLFAGWWTKRPVSLAAEEIRALRALLALVHAARRLRSG